MCIDIYHGTASPDTSRPVGRRWATLAGENAIAWSGDAEPGTEIDRSVAAAIRQFLNELRVPVDAS